MPATTFTAVKVVGCSIIKDKVNNFQEDLDNMTTHRRNGSDSLLPKSTHQNEPPSRNRLHHLDNLRIFLTSLVIIHHTSIPYGGLGNWQLHSPCFPTLSPLLGLFTAVDQTFFMALFFWMAGYFSHLELARRETAVERRDFIRRRVRRLVVPSIFYTVVLEPTLKIMIMLRYCKLDADECGRVNPFILIMKTLFGYWIGGGIRGINGPFWFCMLLAIFDCVAALIRPHQPSGLIALHKALVNPTRLAQMMCIVVLSTFFIRQLYPVGAVVRLLNIQPAFLPQYIFAYVVGHACAAAGAACNGNLRFAGPPPWPHPYEDPFRTLIIALTVQTLTLSLVMLPTYVFKKDYESPLNYLIGGFNLPALLYTIWNEIGFLIIGPALVDLFARQYKTPSSISLPWRRFTIANNEVRVARYAFAAFLVHPVVSVAIEIVVESFMGCEGVDSRGQKLETDSEFSGWNLLGPVVMTAVVGSVNVLVSWVVAFGMLDLIPELGGWV